MPTARSSAWSKPSLRGTPSAELEDDLTYTANELDRDVVNPAQIRLVVQTFRDRLSTDIFPGRTEVPKTLVFAKTDLHADDIVRVIREEFGKGNEFCQKITSKTTGKKPEDLLSEFRNSYHPRIAVTVDMIATGTDVKALECLLFMRNINSASYFEQMKGRGCRIIGGDDLQAVTPDAKSKTHFVIVDAVGVCEKDKTSSKPLDRKPSVPLEKLLQMAAQGMVHPDLVSTLGARLARLNQETDAHHAAETLWSQVLSWQSIYFGLRPTRRLLTLIGEAQQVLAQDVVAASVNAEMDLELYALLEALKHPSKSVSFRVALPNVKLLRTNGTIEHEYDVVSVVLREDKDAEVWVWGVTTDKDVNRKRLDDLGKIQKLKDLLSDRWDGDIRVATCYVHREGNDICCDIDGHSERRPVEPRASGV